MVLLGQPWEIWAPASVGRWEFDGTKCLPYEHDEWDIFYERQDWRAHSPFEDMLYFFVQNVRPLSGLDTKKDCPGQVAKTIPFPSAARHRAALLTGRAPEHGQTPVPAHAFPRSQQTAVKIPDSIDSTGPCRFQFAVIRQALTHLIHIRLLFPPASTISK